MNNQQFFVQNNSASVKNFQLTQSAGDLKQVIITRSINENQIIKNIDSIIKSYKETYQGKIPENVLGNTLASLSSINSESLKYSVKITAQSYIFYSYITIEWDGIGTQLTKKFFGNAGGIGVGGGKASGILYLPSGMSLDDLLNKTKSFQVTDLTGLSTVNIFDASSNPIGHAVAGGVIAGGFIGGGTAYWE